MHITLFDYLLFPVYLALFYFHVRYKSKSYEDLELRKVMMNAFRFRMLGAFLYAMVIEYYYGYGDSFTYYDGGNFFREQIGLDSSNISYLFASFKETQEWYDATSTNMYFSGYFATGANNMVMRVSAIISYLSFNSFLIISLFFAFFSFWGQWKLFLVFDDLNKSRNRKLLSYAVLYSPSIWFWGSGLLKDSISLGSAGFIIYILHKFFVKRKFSLVNLFLLVFFYIIVNLTKSYIITTLLVGIAVTLFAVFLKSIQNAFTRVLLIVFAIAVFVVYLFTSNFVDEINKIAQESVLSIKLFQAEYQLSNEREDGAQAGFGIGELELSVSSMVAKSPVVIFSCLFRPFVWESRKIFIFFTSLESLLVLMSTFYVMFKTGFFGFFAMIFRTPHLVFCFVISMLFALIIGFTTFNFGTLIRYKIIFLPFYYFLLVNMYTIATAKKAVPESISDPDAHLILSK